MPDPQDMAFFPTERPRAQVTKDRAYTFTAKAHASGTQSVPTAATITIKRPGGGAMPTAVSGASMTVAGSGDMTYALTAANAVDIGSGYTADVAYTVSSVVYDGHFLFDVVRFPLRNVVLQSNLVDLHPDLTDILFSGESNYATQIARAYEDIYHFIESKGKRPYLILSSEDLRRPIEFQAMVRILRSRKKEDGDRWDGLKKDYEAQVQRWMDMAQFEYDSDSSGTLDGVDVQGSGGEADRPIAQVNWRI